MHKKSSFERILIRSIDVLNLSLVFGLQKLSKKPIQDIVEMYGKVPAAKWGPINPQMNAKLPFGYKLKVRKHIVLE